MWPQGVWFSFLLEKQLLVRLELQRKGCNRCGNPLKAIPQTFVFGCFHLFYLVLNPTEVLASAVHRWLDSVRRETSPLRIFEDDITEKNRKSDHNVVLFVFGIGSFDSLCGFTRMVRRYRHGQDKWDLASSGRN
jgi:hypothetical protein